MTNQTETRELSRLEWNRPEVIAALPHGGDAKLIYDATQEISENNLRYNPETQEMRGSTPFATGLVYKAIERSGSRPAVPGDDREGDILRLIQGKYYSDFNALVAQEGQPRHERNNGIWRRVLELAEEEQGSLRFPFMVQGFYVAQDENEAGYGKTIIPASNFKVINDDRLSKKYNGWKFNTVDTLGLPEDLDKHNGDRILFTGGDGLSRAYLVRDGFLFFDYGNLEYSDDDGRVVVVGAEGTRENFDAYLTKLREQRADEIAELDRRYTEAKKVLRGE